MNLSGVESKECGEAARKRAAVELIAKHERSLRRTARRFSICADDADDAYQRALEILLVKAPTDDVRQLIRWMTTVVKHEALKVRQTRERTMPKPSGDDGEGEYDWVAQIPADGDGPAGLVERRERVARSREALQALKPAELKALTLLAEGYSYEEIGELTGFSQTKVNRCLAEGRERFRAIVSDAEDGSRCDQMGALLSAFCDGETSPKQTAELREHLRACAHCRAALRTYRVAPRAAAALAPWLPAIASRSLLERAHDALRSLHSRLPGQGGDVDSTLSQIATSGGTHGAGIAATAKVLAVCVGAAGGAAACVATGVVPSPLGPVLDHDRPAVERPAKQTRSDTATEAQDPTPTNDSNPTKSPKEEKQREPEEAPQAPTDNVATDAGSASYAPAPAPAPAPTPATSGGGSSSAAGGNPAGEFGP